MRLIAAIMLFACTGCATSFEVDKTTVVFGGFGLHFLAFRRVEAEGRSETRPVVVEREQPDRPPRRTEWRREEKTDDE